MLSIPLALWSPLDLPLVADFCCAVQGATTGSLRAMQMLVRCKAQVDHETKHGNTALTRACSQGCVSSVSTLLELGASINKETACGITPLIAAASSGEEQIVEMLCMARADLEYETKLGGETAVMKVPVTWQGHFMLHAPS